MEFCHWRPIALTAAHRADQLVDDFAIAFGGRGMQDVLPVFISDVETSLGGEQCMHNCWTVCEHGIFERRRASFRVPRIYVGAASQQQTW